MLRHGLGPDMRDREHKVTKRQSLLACAMVIFLVAAIVSPVRAATEYKISAGDKDYNPAIAYNPDNDEYLVDQTLKQEPIAAIRANLIYHFRRPGTWLGCWTIQSREYVPLRSRPWRPWAARRCGRS